MRDGHCWDSGLKATCGAWPITGMLPNVELRARRDGPPRACGWDMQGEFGFVLEVWEVPHGLLWAVDPSLSEQCTCKQDDNGLEERSKVGLRPCEDIPLQPHIFLAGWLIAS